MLGGDMAIQESVERRRAPMRRRTDVAGIATRPQRTRLRVVIADGDPLSRRVLRDLFQLGSDLSVVAEARDGVEALELTTYYRPEVLLCSFELARLSGLQTLDRVRAHVPQVRVVFLSAACSADAEVAALRAGASGFLSKDADLEDIAEALRRVSRGEATVSSEAAKILVSRLRELPQAGTGLRPVRSGLTPREWQVVDLLSAGLQPAAVAVRLDVVPDTIRSHLKHIMRKLDVRTTDEVIAAADGLCRGSGVAR